MIAAPSATVVGPAATCRVSIGYGHGSRSAARRREFGQ
jgi:hypothetical protein